VPVAEPEWSGAHHGLCLYASRVLQVVWDEQVRREGEREGGGSVCVCVFAHGGVRHTEPQHRSGHVITLTSAYLLCLGVSWLVDSLFGQGRG
jgi:hypothetical protein